MNDTSTNLSKLKREHLLDICSKIKKQEPVEIVEIAELEQFIKSMKYGLNFEKHEEPVDRMLRTHIPVFKEFKEVINNPESADCNFLLEGDNLHSLKLLEKTHKGRIDVCYIDPPYNTLNEDFAYGDKMLDENDGFKHSKWLSFMKERLQIARKLLADDGVIFISIDDREQAQLKLLCDEVFGEENLINVFHWVSNLKGRQLDGHGAAGTTEYILCYSKNRTLINQFVGKINTLTSRMPCVYNLDYKVKKDSIGEYIIKNELYNSNSAFNEETRPNLIYDIYFNPKTGDVLTESVSDTDIHFSEGYIKISPHKNSDGIHKYHAFRWSPQKVKAESFNLYFENKDEKWKVYTKVRNTKTTALKDLIIGIGNGTNELKQLGFGRSFDFPKSTELIKLLLSVCDNKNCLVLDFFAGSGTTGQAVLDLNKEDGGNRHFILCTNNEVSASKQLDYIHSKGYMKDIKTNGKSTQSKINKFFDDNPNAYQELMVDGKENYESYGICQSVTYPRLNTVITGFRPDGTKYSDGIKTNLRYFQTDMVAKDDDDLDELLYDASFCLAELDCMSKIDNKTICIAECDEDVDDIIENATDDLKILFVADDVLFDAKQQEFFEHHNVAIKQIPDYYYKEV